MTQSYNSAQIVDLRIDSVKLTKHLLTNCLVQEDGFGPAIELGPMQGEQLAIGLEIDHIVEHKTLSISIWGSPDGTNWGETPVLTLPPKHYCGEYAIRLDLARYPEARYLRVQWKMGSWHRTNTMTLFGFSVFLAGADFQRHPSAGIFERSVSAGTGALAN